MQKSVLSNTLNHFQTFVWLRWRIRTNQLRHGSALGKALAAILLISFAIVVVGLFVVSAILGALVPRLVPVENYFLFWDGFISLFCFVWVIYVATDIQRTDAISFDRILHLPVSFYQAFAINYLSSMLSMTFVSLCTFGIGFILGSVVSIGPIALLFFIPFGAFAVAITALTYQLQGWLAAIMSNPRRRQLVMITLPLCIIVVSQVPAIFATRFARDESRRNRVQAMPKPTVVESPEALPETENSLLEREPPEQSGSSVAAKQPINGTGIGAGLEPTELPSSEAHDAEAERKEIEAQAQGVQRKQRELARDENRERWIRRIRQANLYFPPLWMAGCVESIVSGTMHVLWLTLAMALVGFVSMQRNYRQTLRYYKGETDARASRTVPAVAVTTENSNEPAIAVVSRESGRKRLLLIERDVPFVSDETSAIIAMTLQSMTRAPEVKLYLLLPLLVPFILFGVVQAWQLPPIDELKAAIVVCISACSLFITSGMLGNIFAYDRAGFRAFVLSPLRRDRILLARNLATTPFLLLQTFLLALAFAVFFGMAFDKLLGAVLLSASILPLYCLLTNVMSILTPFPLAAGSIQPKQFNLVPILFSLVLSMFMPAITVLALLPLGIEWLLDRYLPSITTIPIALLFSIPWLAGSILIYRWLLPWEGKLLAKREKELLRIVTSKIE
jgi:ABC-2 type transport system permease protein